MTESQNIRFVGCVESLERTSNGATISGGNRITLVRFEDFTHRTRADHARVARKPSSHRGKLGGGMKSGIRILALAVVFACVAAAVRTSFAADDAPVANEVRARKLRDSDRDATIEIEVEVFEISTPEILTIGDDMSESGVEGWLLYPRDIAKLRRDLMTLRRDESIEQLGFERFVTKDGKSVRQRLEFDRAKESTTAPKADALEISIKPRLLPGDEISLEYDLVRSDVLGKVKVTGTKRTHLGDLTTLWFKTWEPQVEQSLSQLLSRQIPDWRVWSSDGTPVQKICFVGLQNKHPKEIGEFGGQIYEKIGRCFKRAGQIEFIDQSIVEGCLRECQLRVDELYVPSNQRAFLMAMEKAKQPVDFLLYAKTAAGVKNKDDYLLTLDLVNAKTFTSEKKTAELRKGDEANSGKAGHSWVVFVNARTKTPDGQYATIKAQESRVVDSMMSFVPRPGRYELSVSEGWFGVLMVGNMGDTKYPILESVTNIGHTKDANSDGFVALPIFAAERPVLEVTSADDGFIVVCARRSGTASVRVQVMGLDGKPEPCDLKIIVQADTSEFDRAVKELLPGTVIKIHRLNESAMLTGTVASDEEKTLLNEIAEQFFPKILNRVKVQAGTEGQTPRLEKTSPIDLMKATPRGQIIEEQETLAIPGDLVRPVPPPSPLAANAIDAARENVAKGKSRGKQKRNRLSAKDAERILEEVRNLRRDVHQLSELVERRAAHVDPQQPVNAKSAAVDLPTSPLSKTVSVKFEDTPLQKALAKLSEQAGVNIILDAEVLSDERVRTYGIVSLEMSGVTCQSVLKLMIQPIGLDFIERDGIVVITNRSRAQGKLSAFEAAPSSPDTDDLLARQNVVIRLKNGDAKFIAKAIQEFTQSQREVAHLSPELLRIAEQLDRELVVVPDAKNNNLLLSATPRYFKTIENMILRLDERQLHPSEDSVEVKVYAVADLVIPLPSEGVLKPPGAKDWLSVVDRVKESVDANGWEENGGPFSLKVNETTLSLVVRADRKSHEQIAETLLAMRRILDRQIVITTRILQFTDDSVLEKSGVKLSFDQRTRVAKLNEPDADRLVKFVNSQHGEVLYAPKITIFDGHIAEVHSGVESPDSENEHLHLYVRGRMSQDEKDVHLNLACNPKDLINALAIHSHRIPGEGCVVFDMTEDFRRGKSRNPKGRILVLVSARGIAVMEEPETRSDASPFEAPAR